MGSTISRIESPKTLARADNPVSGLIVAPGGAFTAAAKSERLAANVYAANCDAMSGECRAATMLSRRNVRHCANDGDM